MITEIGIVAGEIWHLLDKHGETAMSHIFEGIDKPRDIILMSLGWLAREGHIVLNKKNDEYNVTLRQRIGEKKIVKIIYSPAYNVDIGNHVFPTTKYDLIYNRLKKENFLSKKDFIISYPAEDEDILRIHTREYLNKLKNGLLGRTELLALELPYSPGLVKASYICAQGTILTAREALKGGAAIHLGGGFHHAFADHGEGFCVFNDIAIAIARLKDDGFIKRALIIDCDLHQGNGTAKIFESEEDVFTLSIHQENNYPLIKPPSNLDIGLADGTGDDGYLKELEKNIPPIIAQFKPSLILYVAGSDPYKFDQLGGLALSIEGLKKRDELIFRLAQKSLIPVAVVLAGGYAINLQDTIGIHFNTVSAALTVYQKQL